MPTDCMYLKTDKDGNLFRLVYDKFTGKEVRLPCPPNDGPLMLAADKEIERLEQEGWQVVGAVRWHGAILHCYLERQTRA